MSLNAVEQHNAAIPALQAAYDTMSVVIGVNHHLDTFYELIVTAQYIEEKTKWRSQLTWTVARHATGEERTYHLTMEKARRRGSEVALGRMYNESSTYSPTIQTDPTRNKR